MRYLSLSFLLGATAAYSSIAGFGFSVGVLKWSVSADLKYILPLIGVLFYGVGSLAINALKFAKCALRAVYYVNRPFIGMVSVALACYLVKNRFFYSLIAQPIDSLNEKALKIEFLPADSS